LPNFSLSKNLINLSQPGNGMKMEQDKKTYEEIA